MRSKNVTSEFNEGENPTGGQTTLGGGSTIDWQNGVVEGGEQNGAFIEDVITAAIQRLEYFNDGKFRCRENSVAITKLEEALMWLRYRTANREEQGVENSYNTHK